MLRVRRQCHLAIHPNARWHSKQAPVNLQDVGTRLRKEIDRQRSLLSMKASTTLTDLNLKWNKVSGYDEIENLKAKVTECERRIHATREASRSAKSIYSSAVLARSSSQQSLTALLQRQPTWSATDLATFTQLLQHDHALSSELTNAKDTVEKTDARLDTEFSELMASILGRYHEEQIWSDKIRSVATYGSLVVLLVNVGVFVVAIVFVEPWKRRRLAETFEKKMAETMLEMNAVIERGLKDLSQELAIVSSMHAASEPIVKRDVDEEPFLDSDGRNTLIPHNTDVVSIVTTTGLVAGMVGWILRSYMGS